MSELPIKTPGPGMEPGLFVTTHWSLVLAAVDTATPESDAALENLCRTYWYPIYACVRRKGRSAEDAQDLTQEFLTRLLEKKYLKLADRQRGRFRDFLRKALDNFLINDWRKTNAAKRGSGQFVLSLDQLDEAENRYQAEPVSPDLTPDRLFEKRWAVALLEQVLDRLRAEYRADGKQDLFDRLKPFVWGEKSGLSQAEVAAAMNLTEAAVSQAVYRLRQRYATLLRNQVGQTVVTTAEVEEELRFLLQAISS